MRTGKLRLRKLEDEYKLLDQIGQGAYGRVFKAEKDGEVVAVKQMLLHTEAEYRLVTSIASLREIKLLRELQHDNVIRLRDQFLDLDKQQLSLVYDFAETDLRRIINEKRRINAMFPEAVIQSYMYQILKGVQYLHENWVIHRDLKPENILVVRRRDRGEILKLADFGLARIFQAPVKALADVERVVVTLWYRAPELLLGSKHYTTAVDMWAVGCIFAELFNRQQLFPGTPSTKRGKSVVFEEHQCKTIFRVLGVPNERRWPGVTSLPDYQCISAWNSGYPAQSTLQQTVCTCVNEDAFDLLSRLLELDPAKRITAADALVHPYFKPPADRRGIRPAQPRPTTTPAGIRTGVGSTLAPSAVPVARPATASIAAGAAMGTVVGAAGAAAGGAAAPPVKRDREPPQLAQYAKQRRTGM